MSRGLSYAAMIQATFLLAILPGGPEAQIEVLEESLVVVAEGVSKKKEEKAESSGDGFEALVRELQELAVPVVAV